LRYDGQGEPVYLELISHEWEAEGWQVHIEVLEGEYQTGEGHILRPNSVLHLVQNRPPWAWANWTIIEAHCPECEGPLLAPEDESICYRIRGRCVCFKAASL
jgi:hypothetical protein